MPEPGLSGPRQQDFSASPQKAAARRGALTNKVGQWLQSALPEGGAALYPLRDLLTEDQLDGVVQVLVQAVAAGDHVDTIQAFVRPILLDRHGARVVRALASHGEAGRETAVVLALVLDRKLGNWRSQIPASVRHHWWQQWPALAAALVPSQQAAQEFHTWFDPLALSDAAILYGGPIEDEVKLPADVLEAQLAFLPETGPPLSPTALQRAVGSALLRLRGCADSQEAMENTIATSLSPLEACLQKTVRAEPGLDRIVACLDRRKPSPVAPVLAWLPWVCGACTLLGRVGSKRPAWYPRWGLPEQTMRDWLTQFWSIGRDLVTHDLCAAEVFLRFRSPRHDMAHPPVML